jgi:2-methylcitrate dehydratase PrpD
MAAPARTATIAEELARWCASLEFREVPADVVERAKDLLMDFLGVCYRGMAAESSAAAVRAAKALSGGGASTLIRHPVRRATAWAALANGTAAHAIEMDDVSASSSLHPGVAVFPAALALAEELASSTEQLLTAVVAGYEVTMRVGNALNGASAYQRGFHPTGVAGAFGSTAACAVLLGLDADRLANALGIAGTMASGSLEYLNGGAWTKRLNAGWAAHCGVVASRLAAEGFTGPATVIEGPSGLLHAYSSEPRPGQATAGLGGGYEIMRVSIKPYACCRYNHGPIDCVLQLRRRVRSLDEVEDIRLAILSGGALLVADPIAQKRAPKNVVEAQFSAPFAAAVALAHGKAGLAEYTQANVEDPRIRQLMARTSCYTDPELDAAYPERWPAVAAIQLRSGERLEARQDSPLGDPANPVSPEELAAKFREMVDAPWADEVIEHIRRLPGSTLEDILARLRG